MGCPVTVQAASSVAVYASTDLTHWPAVAVAADFVGYRFETRPPVARSHLTVTVRTRKVRVGRGRQRHVLVAVEAIVVLRNCRHDPQRRYQQECNIPASGDCHCR